MNTFIQKSKASTSIPTNKSSGFNYPFKNASLASKTEFSSLCIGNAGAVLALANATFQETEMESGHNYVAIFGQAKTLLDYADHILSEVTQHTPLGQTEYQLLKNATATIYALIHVGIESLLEDVVVQILYGLIDTLKQLEDLTFDLANSLSDFEHKPVNQQVH